MKFFYIIFAFITIGLGGSACENKTTNNTNSEEEGYEIRIRNKPGDRYEEITSTDTLRFMSYPFHVGQFRDVKSDELYCIVISTNLGLRNRITIKPVAMLKYRDRGIDKNYIVGIPIDTDHQAVYIEDFSDFILNYVSIKNIIQTWLLNRCGLGCAQLIGWENEQYAELYLQKRKL